MESYEIEYFESENAAIPLKEWLDALDKKMKARILARLARVRSGNLGDYKNLGQGLFEMRMDFGPGYRIYYFRQGQKVIILFSGGDKSSQSRDIAFARECLASILNP